jgi:hypothetical protein
MEIDINSQFGAIRSANTKYMLMFVIQEARPANVEI